MNFRGDNQILLRKIFISGHPIEKTISLLFSIDAFLIFKRKYSAGPYSLNFFCLADCQKKSHAYHSSLFSLSLAFIISKNIHLIVAPFLESSLVELVILFTRQVKIDYAWTCPSLSITLA